MILGMSTETFTQLHVAISIIAILSGLFVVFGWISGARRDGATAIFLATTILTSVTGFLFPFAWTPGNIIGVLSMFLLTIAVLARYQYKLAGGWRRTYVITAVISLYFNFFVFIVQSFQKIPPLHELAPKGSEPPFAVVQLVALAMFVWIGFRAVKGFRATVAT